MSTSAQKGAPTGNTIVKYLTFSKIQRQEQKLILHIYYQAVRIITMRAALKRGYRQVQKKNHKYSKIRDHRCEGDLSRVRRKSAESGDATKMK